MRASRLVEGVSRTTRKLVVNMAAPASEQVRNVVLVGQDGAGKTSLAEAMLHVSGRTPRMGTTHDGKSYLDFDEEEIRRKFTISTSIAPIPYKNFKINLLDTSGHPDFIGDTIATMYAAETALFVVDAVAGPQVMTTKLWKTAADMKISRAVFINHIDRENANFDVAMAALHARFGSRLVPVTIPIGVQDAFEGVIDIVRMKARYFDKGGIVEREEEIPASYIDQAQNARDRLVDNIAEADEELMMKYLEGEQLSQEEIETLLGNAINQELVVPVYVGSTIIKQGIQGLMEDICTFFPHPVMHCAYALANDAGKLTIDEAGSPAGFVFKTVADQFVGRMSYVKVLTGVLEPGQDLANSRTGKKDRVGHLYMVMGQETTDVKSAKAGDIIVIPKLSDTRPGDTLSIDGSLELAPMPLPTPLYPVAIEAANKKEEDKLGTFLARVAENDPTMKIRRDEETHQTVIEAMGDEQVNTMMNRLKAQIGIEARLIPVCVPYRETIRKTAEAQGRHKKQTGGSGQFGDCWLRLEPNPDGGYEFLDEIVGGHIPRAYIPAVDKGVQEAMAEGFLAGYPMVDIKVAVYEGSYHPVDSNEMAFKTAARIGFRAACEKASPVLLEPMADVRVEVPEDYAGAVMGDISTRRGRIVGTDSAEDGQTAIIMRVPYAEMLTYTRDLRSMTRGTGSYTIAINGYEQVPMDIQKKLVDEYQAARAEGK